MFLSKILTFSCTDKHYITKHFCIYYLQSFSTAQILKIYVVLKSTQNIIKMAKKGETVKFENYTRKNHHS